MGVSLANPGSDGGAPVVDPRARYFLDRHRGRLRSCGRRYDTNPGAQGTDRPNWGVQSRLWASIMYRYGLVEGARRYPHIDRSPASQRTKRCGTDDKRCRACRKIMGVQASSMCAAVIVSAIG